MKRWPTTVAVCILAMIAVGCREESEPTEHQPRGGPILTPTTQPAAGSQQPGDTGTPPLPPGHPALPPTHPPIGPATAEDQVQLVFDAPDAWVERPARTMTLKIYALPKVEGDPEDADLAVSTLGPRRVPLAANVGRWCQQFDLADGKTCEDFGPPVTLENTKYPTVLVELAGTYKGGSMFGPPEPPKPDFRMIAAEITTPTEQWYLKLVGPQRTVEHWREAFVQYVRSARTGNDE